MNDERFLKDWLDDDAPDPAGARRDADQIMARVSETKQRSRWWPLLPARRSRPRSSSDGQPLAINGRTQSMFSPAKAITAGALIFAIGGAFLIAQPFDQQPVTPGAEAEAIAPTWITGSIQAAPSCSGPDSDEVDGDVRRSRIIECSPQMWTSSDPRLTGEVVRRWNDDIYQTDEGVISVNMDAVYLTNGGGGWACSNSSLLRGFGRSAELVTGPTYTFTCTGDGGHEGLSAILVAEDGPGFNEEFVGLIFSGDFPPLPEAPATE